jgi:hypothetical protein
MHHAEADFPLQTTECLPCEELILREFFRLFGETT